MHLRNLLRIAAAMTFTVLATGLAAGESPRLHSIDDPALEWGPCPGFFPETCRIAVLHGDPAEPDADIFFRVPAGADLPRHTHTSAERMVLVSGRMRVDYDGHEPVVIDAGEYAYGPPGMPHSAQCLDAGDCVLFIAFVDPVDAFEATAGAPSGAR